jgi:hypothetical protein
MKIGEKSDNSTQIGVKSSSGRQIGAKADNLYGATSNETQVVLDPKIKEELMRK